MVSEQLERWEEWQREYALSSRRTARLGGTIGFCLIAAVLTFLVTLWF